MSAGVATPPAKIVPQKNLNVHLICKRCQVPTEIVERFAEGDMLCGECGLVLGDRIIDTRSEWRTFANSEDGGDDPSRVGAAGDPLLGGINQLEATVISARDGGSGAARDLSRINNKIQGQRAEKHLAQAFKHIQSMAEHMNLAKIVVDSAKQIYKLVDDDKTFKGKSPEAIAAACIYIACRQNAATRTFKEVCGATNVPKKEIGRMFKQIQAKVLSKGEGQEKVEIQKVEASSYISRFADHLNFDAQQQRATQKVYNAADKKGTLAGKSPISIVAACLYFACQMSNKPTTPEKIANVAGCTEATLKNAYKLLYENREEFGKDLGLPKGVKDLPEP
ncbi:transcription initiation factor IIB [Rhizophlyctis rosea]|nr:transcription initiation factor IIB [Rhizophlyctis rosea]